LTTIETGYINTNYSVLLYIKAGIISVKYKKRRKFLSFALIYGKSIFALKMIKIYASEI